MSTALTTEQIELLRRLPHFESYRPLDEVEAIGKDAGILGAASPTPSAPDLTQAEQLLADVVKAWSQPVAPAERDRRIAKAMRAADDYFVANHSVTQRGGSADHKPNTPQTPTPKVEDSVVEVGE